VDIVERKSLLNKSALGFLCVNHVQGCSHGCRYPCYAFSMARGWGRTAGYDDWVRPKLVGKARELLEKELKRLKARVERGAAEMPDSVHFCLTTDPFMFGAPEVAELSMDLIAMVNAEGIAASVLTKGVLPAELADRRRFPCDNVYGISLVSLSEEFRRKWEPGAAPYAERIAALRRLREAGRGAYVHIEPYPTPNVFPQNLGALLEAVGFADSLYFGGWNYSPLTSKFPDREGFYRECSAQVRRFCKERGMEYKGGEQ
jgi:DNA repair photolyase